MNNEISQAERTAMEAVEFLVPWCLLSKEEIAEAEAYWLAARDYGRERERALEVALRRMIAVTELPGTRSELSPQTERAKSIARAALAASPRPARNRLVAIRTHDGIQVTFEDTERPAASQPEVLSERSDTEPGEPEGTPSGRITKPDEFPRFLECPGCGMKRLFSPYEGRCDECRAQPDHGPGEPSEALKRLKRYRDRLENETGLLHRDNDEKVEVTGYLLHCLAQAIDAVLVGERNG